MSLFFLEIQRSICYNSCTLLAMQQQNAGGFFCLIDCLFLLFFLWFVFIVCGLRARKRNMLFFSGKKNIIGDCLISFFSVKVLLFYTVSDTTSWTGIVLHIIFNKTVRPRLYALVSSIPFSTDNIQNNKR